jgi:integrase
VRKAFTEQQPRVVFLTLVLDRHTALRATGSALRDIDLVENRLRVVVSPRPRRGVRSVALSPALAEELWQWRRETKFQGDDERVFCNQVTGGEYDEEHFAAALRAALKTSGIDDYVRPFHDLRHTAITNDAAAGFERDRGHGEGGALLDGDDEALPAPRGCRLSRRGGSA